MMVSDTNWSTYRDVKWPTTTTGTRAWKSWGGLPVLATSTTSEPWQMVKSVPDRVAWMLCRGRRCPPVGTSGCPGAARWAMAWLTVSK